MPGLRTAEWKRLRLEIIRRDQNTCYLCGVSGDTGTKMEVDHIRPRAKGGSDYDPENLACICRRCNLLKSDKLGHKGVFLAPQSTPPDLAIVDLSANVPISTDLQTSPNQYEPDITDSAKTNVSQLGGRLIGSPTPRIFAHPVDGNRSRAQQAIDLAAEIGIELMPWQKHALGDILNMQHGKYVRRVMGLVCARQQGKTELAKIRIIAGIYLFNEKDVILLSVNRKLSLITWRQIDYLIQNTPRLKALWAKSYTTNGAERIVFKNGAQISVVAATPNGSRGMTADLVFIDETRAIDQGTWDAAVYTTNARPLAQVLTVSNAGDKSSTVLNNLRDRAIANVSPTLGWLEWSAHPSREIMDKRGWIESNPALGWTMDEATMQHNAVTNDPLAFRVEVLCQFLDNLASPFEIGSWQKCADESIVLEPGGVTYFAFDKSYTHKYAVLVAGQKLDELRVKVKVLQVWSTTTPLDDRQLASDINGHIQRFRPKVVMYDKWVSENVASYLKASGSPLMDVSGKAQNEASNRLAQLMSHTQVIHGNEQILNEAIAACATKHTEYGWKIVRRKSAGEICAAISVAMVAWYASRPQAVASIIVN